MEQESSNALRYRKLLKKAAEGICLWYPSKTAVVGSVGYLRDGRFVTVREISADLADYKLIHDLHSYSMPLAHRMACLVYHRQLVRPT